MLPDLSKQVQQLEDTPRRLTVSPSPEGTVATAGTWTDSKATTVFDDIAHAHREIYALYEIAQTMGTSLGVSDTMALITSKLSSLVPFSSCALVPLRRGDRDASLPVCDRRRSRRDRRR